MSKSLHSQIKEELGVSRFMSLGNHKLPKTTAIFNLPSRATCPGMTNICEKICYASKAEHMYVTVLSFRKEMFKLSKREIFQHAIVDELRAKQNITACRIHESGDFYSQKYLDKWVEIAREMPNLTFYAYTRSYKLDYSKRPSNMKVHASLDEDNWKEGLILANSLDGWTYIDTGVEIPKELAVLNPFNCPMSCKNCDYCLNASPARILFPKH